MYLFKKKRRKHLQTGNFIIIINPITRLLSFAKRRKTVHNITPMQEKRKKKKRSGIHSFRKLYLSIYINHNDGLTSI